MQIVLFVNDASRLAVVTPARETRLLARLLTTNLSSLFQIMGVPSRWIEAEMREMAEIHFARTNSRSVLGSMIDYKNFFFHYAIETGVVDTFDMSRELIEWISGPLGYASPGEVARERLQQRYGSMQ